MVAFSCLAPHTTVNVVPEFLFLPGFSAGLDIGTQFLLLVPLLVAHKAGHTGMELGSPEPQNSVVLRFLPSLLHVLSCSEAVSKGGVWGGVFPVFTSF